MAGEHRFSLEFNVKKIFLIVLLLFLSSCASVGQYQNLENRVAILEKQKKSGAMMLAQEAGAAHFWWRNALQGNTTGSIDGITGANNGDVAMMVNLLGTTATGYLWVYDADGTASDYPVACTTECTDRKSVV